MNALPFHATAAQISAWRRSRAARNLATRIVATHPTCHLRLPGICTGRSTTNDHIIPVRTNPTLADNEANCRGACKPCNSFRQDMPIAEARALAARLHAEQLDPAKRAARARRHIAGRKRAHSHTANAYFNTSTPRRTA